MIKIISALFCAVLLLAACQKKEATQTPVQVAPSVASPQNPANSSAASLPTPPLPDPKVPDEVPTPKPGQANDHSSPAFKDGGTPAKK